MDFNEPCRDEGVEKQRGENMDLAFKICSASTQDRNRKSLKSCLLANISFLNAFEDEV